MTSAQVPSRIAIKRPFAENGLITPIADVSGDDVNYPQGFPSIYGVPASEGGKYVGRGDINAIGNVATNDLFYHKCGGINTFDAAFSAKVGGYPKGAVLKCLNGNYIYDVISLVDNNTFDFVANNSIDNVNWAYCNKDVAASDRILVVESSTAINANNSQGLLLGVFKAPKNGSIIFEGGYNINGINTNDSSSDNAGMAVAIYDLGTSYTTIPNLTTSNLNTWKTIYSASVFWERAEYTSTNYRAPGSAFNLSTVPNTEMLTYGHYYAISAICGTGAVRSIYAAGEIGYAASNATGSCKIYIQ